MTTATATPKRRTRRSGVVAVTRRWVRNRSDELAVENGCRFDVARGLYAVWWIERFCKLYEGEFAGQPMLLRGCAECPHEWDIPDEFDLDAPPAVMLDRERAYSRCVRNGHACDWQYEITMRLFGWITYSDDWGRWVRRFREASIWVPKKNKKSPTLAAWGLYLLMADGEMGQKVFSCALDGQQARLSHQHAYEMVSMSPELSAECELNKTTLLISHPETRSRYSILSSDDTRTQKAKEGLNGSVLTDETHVVDRSFMGRISRAGISRSEPIRAEVSTTGDNPDSYGKSQYLRGKEVEAGRIVDQALLFAAYEIPQDTSDEEIHSSPEKYGRMANPAWGHTVHRQEFLDDYNRSRVSIPEFARFKMYRLNQWQQTVNVWLPPGAWAACEKMYTAEDLEGSDCYGGLDLSRTRDMTALVLDFPQEDERHRLLPFFWLPQATAERLNIHVPAIAWGDAGHIELIPGNVIDYGYVKRRVQWINDRFRCRGIAYDDKYAEDLTQWIEDECGIERIAFSQQYATFAAPTDEFERLVLDKKIEHNGHPVLAWQFGHAQLKSGPNGYRKPFKPGRDDYRSIDGVVSAIMARALSAESGEGSSYDKPGEGMYFL